MKLCSVCSQRIHFNSNEVKQGSKNSGIFHSNSGEVKQHTERRQRSRFNNNDERKEQSECCQRFQFNSSEVK